jgi:hypothetical protein
MFDARKIFFNAETDYMVPALDAEWRAVATGEIQPAVELKLSTCSLELCRLGDFIAFLISHMALRSGGRLLALGLACFASFAEWLSDCLPRLVCST